MSRQHGPFHIAHVSTSDSSSAPAVYCVECGADCRSLFSVFKSRGEIMVANGRTRPAVFIAMDDAITIKPGYSGIYRAGRWSAGPKQFSRFPD